MKEIGELLKQKRLEKGFTIDQIAEKTKMPIVRIKAIEEGDITVFKDDITYLQFFLQAYCNAVGINYQEIKEKLHESIDNYTMSFEKEKVRAIAESEKNIRENSKKKVHEYNKKYKKTKVKREVDFSLITFIAVIALVVLCCLTVGGYYLAQHFENNPSEVLPPVVNEPDKPDKPQDDIPEVPVVKEINIVKTDATHYVIENAEEKFTLTIEFHANSWLKATLDGTVMKDPVGKVYDTGTKLEIELDPTKNQEILLNFGYFAKTKMWINDKEVEIDDSIANKTGVVNITYTFGGNENESTE